MPVNLFDDSRRFVKVGTASEEMAEGIVPFKKLLSRYNIESWDSELRELMADEIRPFIPL